MRHYFYFKKGQAVPVWLMRARDQDTLAAIPLTFGSNGKVILDDETGKAAIYPANKRNSGLLVLRYNGRVIVDSGGTDAMNYVFLPTRGRKRNISPLGMARHVGFKAYASTKCTPIPEQFNRRWWGAVEDDPIPVIKCIFCERAMFSTVGDSGCWACRGREC